MRNNLCLRIFVVTLLIAIFSFSCARSPAKIAEKKTGVSMVTDINSFRGLAHVMAERHGIKWANSVSILVKRPRGLRIDALEKITDVVATISVRDDEGYLELPLQNKRNDFKNGMVMLPNIGEIPLTTDQLADILVGRPKMEGGGAIVTESFHTDKGSYFIKGSVDEMEMSSSEKMPLVYTRFTSKDKKAILYEVNFDNFVTFGGSKFPKHVIIRFEHPKMIMDVNYKDIEPGADIPWSLIKR